MPNVFDHLPRAGLATLPTPLEPGPTVDGVRIWIKRDDLTGLGGGGNKARKLEFLCGDAQASGSTALVTVGAAQSNHCRMTAAAGARLGLDVHLVVSGEPPTHAAGNQLLSRLFGAQLHFTGAEDSHWGELEIAREALVDDLAAGGDRPYSIPIGGSTPVGAIGYAAGYLELQEQCDAQGVTASAVVVTSSSGGTHAGLVAGRAIACAEGRSVPDVVAVGVARGVNLGVPDVAELSAATLDLIGSSAPIGPADVVVDGRWIGDDYAVPTDAGDAAIRWAARTGGWLLDRTYSGKGLSGLLGMIDEGRFGAGDDVVFVHTGGWPALFAPGGCPDDR
jgi:1-aminocyclopropane-1-carboxylate deaminase/D-cysteine desulfhydrase-like pyridoxal-dependent ACC family enzyme